MILKEKIKSTYLIVADFFPMIHNVSATLRWHYHYNYISYSFHRLRGVTYKEWYARTLDSFADTPRLPCIEGFEEKMGGNQLDYVKKQGLKPDHSLLDYGCGYLRAGIHFIQYLESGHYTGLDLSKGRIAQGERFVAKFGLLGKKPRLIASPHMDLAKLHGMTFDYIWAHGVLSHMPVEDIEFLIKNLPSLLGKDSMFLGNYTELAEGEVRMATLRHFFFNRSVFERLCEKYGLRCEFLPDWENSHPHELSKIDRMIKITHTSARTSHEARWGRRGYDCSDII